MSEAKEFFEKFVSVPPNPAERIVSEIWEHPKDKETFECVNERMFGAAIALAETNRFNELETVFKAWQKLRALAEVERKK